MELFLRSLIVVVYYAFIVFITVMFYRIAKAVEKIADRIDQGLTIRKEDMPR
jgi:hypothetical protein